MTFPNPGPVSTWLVVGGSGLLGSNFALDTHRYGPVWVGSHLHPVQFRGCQSVVFDICDESEVRRILEMIRPNCVFHAAAMTNVDECERHPDQAREVNALGAGRVAAAAHSIGACFVYISTDSVFDGARGSYAEEETPSPVNCYAATKLEGEQRVREVHGHALVVRTNFYGWGNRPKPSYSEWLLHKLEAGVPFPVVQDVYFNPLLVNSVCDFVLRLVQRGCDGVIHLGNSTPCSKLEFARSLARVFGFNPDRMIQPASVGDLGLAAVRPRNTTLNCSRAEQFLKRAMPSLDKELDVLYRSASSGLVSKLRAAVSANANPGGR